MRKKIIGFLIIPILLIAVVGCDLDSLSSFMGKMGENVLTGAGIVTVDDTQTKNVANNVNKLFDDVGDVDPAVMKQVKEDLKDVFESPKKTEDLKEKLSKPASQEAKDKAEDDFEDVLKEIFGDDADFGDLDFEIESEADLLVASLLLDLAENVKDKGKEIEEMDESDALEIISDALFIVEVINALSPAGSVDLSEAFTDILSSLGDRGISRNGNSRDGGNDFDENLENFIIPILRPILNAIDTNKNGIIDSKELKAISKDYAIMKDSYEKLAKGIIRDDGSVRKKLKTSDPINYAISVIFTSGHTLFKTYKNDEPKNDIKNTQGFRRFLNDVMAFLKAYDKNKDADPNDYFGDLENFVGDEWENFFEDSGVDETLLNLLKASPLAALADEEDFNIFG